MVVRSCVLIVLSVILFTSCKRVKEDIDNPVLGNETVTFMITRLPDNHQFKDDIYLSGNFEGWSGGRPRFKLSKLDKQYVMTLPKYKEQISFKFTLGSWDKVECAQNGNPIENRSYIFNKLNDTVDVEIVKWHDSMITDKSSTASKNVEVFSSTFYIPQLKRTRKISVYLPPSYEVTNNSFPVLYMLDGQNVFDASTSYSGEWEVDETLNNLYKEKGFELIVVAIDHGADKRVNEYSAWNSKKYGLGEGDAFLNFITQHLKPAIDKHYRTKTGPLNTAILGSSLGGLFAHFTAFKEPEVFGLVGVFSPSFWYTNECYTFTKERAHGTHSRLYYLAGEKESDSMVFNINKMVKLIKSEGFPEKNIYLKVNPNGTHSEIFWRDEFQEAITWLFQIK
ncbi:alpha/beta hydrolase [Cognatitamlana onchidii]|uniref:alpha/beta hydrolase n=1 Tax=Cognatitamlana onchidii TaxID=2562860 RepID=UPI0010A67F8F|nr:alpha/beta hydrolase-fold protein [Algibacter onchidii]